MLYASVVVLDFKSFLLTTAAHGRKMFAVLNCCKLLLASCYAIDAN